MSFLTGTSKGSWQPIMTAKTNTQSYWLNWRVFLCTIWILVTLIFSSFLIWKYEHVRKKPARNNGNGGNGENLEEEAEEEEEEERTSATLYEDETWRPCLKGVHPAWLLAFRVLAFIILLVLLIVNAAVDGGRIFYYYTQWTFTSITIYFGLGSLLSIHGCYQHHKKATGDKVDNVDGDAEQGFNGDPALPQSSNAFDQDKILAAPKEHLVRQHAGTWGYIFQIIFQMNAGDTALNSLPFPWFRIGYFCLWTVTYVIFQWMVHACIYLWWPYTFLDLSSPYAPLWYFAVALLHIPCYGVFALIMKLKHYVLSTRYPDKYLCSR